MVCRAVGLDPGGDRTWGAWPIAPQLLMPRPAVTTSSVCGMVGRGGACWRGLWEAWWPCPTGLCFLALGVLEYRVLGTNFRDFAIVFTQLEQREEAFSTVELYSEWPRGQRRVCCPCRPPPGPALTRHPRTPRRPDATGQPRGCEPLYQVEPGPGLPVAAAGPAAGRR